MDMKEAILAQVKILHPVVARPDIENARHPNHEYVEVTGCGFTNIQWTEKLEGELLRLAHKAVVEAAKEQLPITTHSWTMGGGQAAQRVYRWCHTSHIYSVAGIAQALGFSWLVRATNKTNEPLEVQLVEDCPAWVRVGSRVESDGNSWVGDAPTVVPLGHFGR